MNEKDIFKRIYGFDENDIDHFFGRLKQEENHMLSWDEAASAMKAEGYWFEITAWPIDARGRASTTDKAGMRTGETIEATRDEPIAVINDLLQKCRARWPKADPWDAMSLDELLAECDRRYWRASLGMYETPNRDGSTHFAYINDDPTSEARSYREAVLVAMRSQRDEAQ